MRLLQLALRVFCAIPLSAVIGLMAWYLWFQEEMLQAFDEYTA